MLSSRPRQRLPSSFFAVDSPTLARKLLGQVLVRVLPDGTRLAGRIVETEAYCGIEDKAAHSYGGRRTPRTEPMFAKAGTAYVYFIWGNHHCLNIICGNVDEPVGVLLRAVEPVDGIDHMLQLRNQKRKETSKPVLAKDLTSGPGKLCQAMCIDMSFRGMDVTSSPSLFVEEGMSVENSNVVNCPRIGVDSAQEWSRKKLRWYVRDSSCVSVRYKGEIKADYPSDPSSTMGAVILRPSVAKPV